MMGFRIRGKAPALQMRLWSLHPKYLDAKGLVAAWREGLLALAVLEGKTKGYRKHPQLRRFHNQEHPVESVKCYLLHLFRESTARDYHFDSGKLGIIGRCEKMTVTKGQLLHEMNHLQRKLKARDASKYRQNRGVRSIESHPLFRIVDGDIEEWEKTNES